MTTGRRVERYELVVIGGGQAGLAAGYWLARHDIDFVILDANPRVGDSWRQRWDSLQLFTPAKYSGLPGLRIPGDPYRLPDKDDLADYLEWYAQVFDLPVRNNARVSRMRRIDGMYRLETNGNTFETDSVIVATGPFHSPRIPEVSVRLGRDIVQLHSSAYRNPAQLPDGAALVVGAANSGAQIAMELAKSRRVYLAGRSVGSLPRRILGRDLFDWLYATVMRPNAGSMIGRRIRASVLGSTDALIGMSERDIARAGIIRTTRIDGARAGLPTVVSGEALDVRSVVWATGFNANFSWIDLPVFAETGFPNHERGVVGSQPGLYFVGLRFQNRLNSSLVGGVGADAEYVASAVMQRYGDTRSFGAPFHLSRRAAAM
jgi:putative flavoprotein involved in K+ transport